MLSSSSQFPFLYQTFVDLCFINEELLKLWRHNMQESFCWKSGIPEQTSVRKSLMIDDTAFGVSLYPSV